MEILGIGPGEFIFILIILLVVVGPERLPDLARQAGRMLVRGRNWLQSSPDAAMVMRARQEIEQELATLKTSLLEVQNVRDEVLGAAKQIGAEVNSLTAATKAELSELGTIAPPKLAAPPPNTISVDAAPALAESSVEQAASTIGAPAPAEPLAAEAAAPPALVNPLQELEETLARAHGRPASDEVIAEATAAGPELPAEAGATDGVATTPVQTLRQPRQPLPIAEPPAAEPDGAMQVVFESIDLRLQAIMTDLFALQEQLKQRGVLADEWQPPSWNMQLPGDEPASQPAPPSPEEAVETEEAPNVQ